MLEVGMAFIFWLKASFVEHTWLWVMFYMALGAFYGIMVYREFLGQKETSKG